MGIPHWIGSLVIFTLIGGFVVFAFRQGMAVKPRQGTSEFWRDVPPFSRPEEGDPKGDNPEREDTGHRHFISARHKRARRMFRPGDIAAAVTAIAFIVFFFYSVATNKWDLTSLIVGAVSFEFWA
jgi:hypothetical protein